MLSLRRRQPANTQDFKTGWISAMFSRQKLTAVDSKGIHFQLAEISGFRSFHQLAERVRANRAQESGTGHLFRNMKSDHVVKFVWAVNSRRKRDRENTSNEK